MFYVYEIRNIENNRVYVGKTGDLEDRWGRHTRIAFAEIEYNDASYIHRALAAHGEDKFVFSIIESFEDERECLAAEVRWIAEFKSNVSRHGKKFGYNLTDGGEGISGYKHTEASKKKMSEARKGHIVSEETREKLRQINLNMTPEHKLKISLGQMGKKRTEEHKLNISRARMGKYTGEENPFFGKHHTEETKKKFRGENSSSAKLVVSQVIEIREKYAVGNITQQKLADEYGVSRRAVGFIIKGTTWEHLLGVSK